MSKTRAADWLIGALIFGAAAGVGLWQAAVRGTWTDEAATVFALTKPLTETVAHDVNPPGSYVAWKAWRSLGTSLFHLRSLSSLLCGAAAVMLFAFARRLRGRGVGVLAALLFVVAPMPQFWAAQVRYPMLLTALLLATALALESLTRAGRRADAVAWVALCVAAFYVHYLALFVLAAHAVFLWRRRAELADRRRTWHAAAIATALMAVWAPVLLWHLFQREIAGGGDPVRWPLLMPLAAVYLTQGFHYWQLPSFWREVLAPSVDYLPLLTALPFVALLLTGLLRRHKTRDDAMIATLAVVPLALYLIASLALRLFAPQYFLPFFPFLCLAAADGAACLWVSRRRALAVALSALTVAASAGGALELWREPDVPERWRDLAAQIADAAYPGDVVLVPNLASWLCYSMNRRDALPAQPLWQTGEGQTPSAPGEVEARLASLATNYRRALYVAYYPARFDPTNAVEHATARIGGTAVAPFGAADPRVALRLLYLHPPLSAESLAPVVRFPNGPQHPAQIGDGWYPTADRQWWTSAAAQVILPAPASVSRLHLAANLPLTLFGANPPDLRITLNGRPLPFRVSADGGIDIDGPADVPYEPWVVVDIACSRTFVPDEVFHDGDRRPKCLLVERIGWGE